MGFSGMSYGSWLMIGFIALVMFGPQKLKAISKDLGEAFAAFKDGMDKFDKS